MSDDTCMVRRPSTERHRQARRHRCTDVDDGGGAAERQSIQLPDRHYARTVLSDHLLRPAVMSVEALSARLAALQHRVSELEGSNSAGEELYHDRFESRPPPKSHTTDLVACQRDSMLRTLTTTVVACEQKPKAAAAGAKKKKKGSVEKQVDLWLVQLEDTVLFPEGGGQPADTGTLAIAGAESAPVRVSHVYRTPDGVVLHEASSPLSVGASVVVTLDWERRFDHMQCHSAQHLISALALRSGSISPGRPEHKIKTHSWELGSSSVVVELEVDSTTPEGAAAINEIEEVRSISRGTRYKKIRAYAA